MRQEEQVADHDVEGARLLRHDPAGVLVPDSNPRVGEDVAGERPEMLARKPDDQFAELGGLDPLDVRVQGGAGRRAASGHAEQRDRAGLAVQQHGQQALAFLVHLCLRPAERVAVVEDDPPVVRPQLNRGHDAFAAHAEVR